MATEKTIKLSDYYLKKTDWEEDKSTINQTINDLETSIATSISNLELVEVVDQLPSSNIKTNKLYLTNEKNTNQNKYDIYIYVNNNWEKVDSIDFNISEYIKKDTNNNTKNNLLLASGSTTPQSTFATAHTHPYLSSSAKAVKTSNLDDQAVTNEKIKNGTIETSKLKNYPIMNADIGTNAGITYNKLSGVAKDDHTHNYIDKQNGIITNQYIANDAISNQHINTNANIDASKIVDNRGYSNIGTQENTKQNAINYAIDAALNTKVTKVDRKGLSTHDFDDTYKGKIDNLKTVATSGSYNDLSNLPNLYQTKITCNILNEHDYIQKYEISINDVIFVIIELRDPNNNLIKNTEVELTTTKGYFIEEGYLEWNQSNGYYRCTLYELESFSSNVTINTHSDGYAVAIYKASESGLVTFSANNTKIQCLVNSWEEITLTHATLYVNKVMRCAELRYHNYTENAPITLYDNNSNRSKVLDTYNIIKNNYAPLYELGTTPSRHDYVVKLTPNGQITYRAEEQKGVSGVYANFFWHY